eukprot:7449550-Alexandrium_andersonii.AAC.1
MCIRDSTDGGLETPDFKREAASFQDCSGEAGTGATGAGASAPTQLDTSSASDEASLADREGHDAMSAVDRMAADAAATDA